VQRGLELALREEPIRPQDHIYLLGGAGRNPKGRRLCWEFVQAHWGLFFQRYGNGGLAVLSRVVSAATGAFASEGDAEAVEGFFEKQDTSAIDRAISQSVEGIRMNAAWLDRNRESVAQFFSTLYN
jgi:puromycin-sensitive aminopeptidase